MVLTVGNKTAEFNGREITLQAAPVSIRYVSAKNHVYLFQRAALRKLLAIIMYGILFILL